MTIDHCTNCSVVKFLQLQDVRGTAATADRPNVRLNDATVKGFHNCSSKILFGVLLEASYTLSFCSDLLLLILFWSICSNFDTRLANTALKCLSRNLEIVLPTFGAKELLIPPWFPLRLPSVTTRCIMK